MIERTQLSYTSNITSPREVLKSFAMWTITIGDVQPPGVLTVVGAGVPHIFRG